MAENVAPYNNIPSRNLTYDAELSHTFLLLSADTTLRVPLLTARFMTAAGAVQHTVRLTASDLSAGA